MVSFLSRNWLKIMCEIFTQSQGFLSLTGFKAPDGKVDPRPINTKLTFSFWHQKIRPRIYRNYLSNNENFISYLWPCKFTDAIHSS